MGTLYENIVFLCDQKGVKPGKMCNEAGISRGLITDLKMGRKNNITVETAKKMADFFGVSVDCVLRPNQKEKSPTPDGVELDAELIMRLCNLTPDEIQKVDAFVQGILASR